jgi:translation initiation factor 1
MMMDNNDFNNFNNFNNDKFSQNIVHIRIQQRNGKKCITTVVGLAYDLDIKKITKFLKSKFKTSGNVKNNEENNNKIIQLSGDQRASIRDFLIEEEICDAEQIILHGG